METLFQPPELGLDDLAVIGEIGQIRERLASVLRVPKRWDGGLRRTAQARAIQGSNSIEGYTVSDPDVAAAVEDEPPLTADERTWAEIIGYRRVLTYVLSVASEPGFAIDESMLRSMHFMLLEHELAKSPPAATAVRRFMSTTTVATAMCMKGPSPKRWRNWSAAWCAPWGICPAKPWCRPRWRI
ncbi:MAG: hypothetical protein QM619_07890 [Micropruina sp.]